MDGSGSRPPRKGFDMTIQHHEDYPAWICADCGVRLGKRIPFLATWHEDTCGWCARRRAVTEPRDYGWPAAANLREDEA